MKKRMLSILLTLALVVSNLPSPALLVEAASSEKAIYDPFLVKLEADQKTVIPVEGDKHFGSEAAAGRTWTDKSVEATGDGGFDVTLSALAQEYMMTGENGSGGSGGYNSSKAPAVDVTFILDMSGSMNAQDIADGTSKYYRVQAMAKATNNVIKTVMEANPKNRVAVHWFGNLVNTAHVGTLMEMGSYTVDSGKDYINYTNTSGTHTLKTDASLKRNAAAYAPSRSKSLVGGTPTQNGIMYGVSNMIADIGSNKKSEYEPNRTPFVLVLSDGTAIQGKKDWYNRPSNPIQDSSYASTDVTNHLPGSGGSGSGTGRYINTGSADITAVTILTGRYMKARQQSEPLTVSPP